MSASAAGAPQPPNGPPGGNGSSKEPGDKPDNPWPPGKDINGHNNWLKNDKVKTAKCNICGERVTTWSWDCDKCLKRICSECADFENGDRRQDFKHIAKNHLDKKCNCAYKFTSGQAPELAPILASLGIDLRPPKRFEQDAKNRQQKEDAAIKRKEKEKAAKQQAKRGGKRKPEDDETDEDFDNGELMTPKKPRVSKRRENKRPVVTTVPQPCEHLQSGRTIIVGGGIVGLCIARELATRAKETKTKHTIHVIEPRDGTCQLASGQCAGLISVHNWQQPCESLMALVHECWAELAVRQGDALQRADFVKDCVYQVAGHKSDGAREHMPSWYPGRKGDKLYEDDGSMGKLDAVQFATWLREDCLRLGVHMHDKMVVTKATDTGDRIAVYCQLANAQATDPIETFYCKNLVLAAGPYTPEIFRKLFSESSIQLENNVKRAYWMSVPAPDMKERDNVGLLFPGLAEADDELDDGIAITGRFQRKDVMAYGTDADTQQAGLATMDALQSDQGGVQKPAFLHLQKLAAKRLGKDPKTIEAARDVAKGSAWVSTATNGRPIIDKVPASALRKGSNAEPNEPHCGVWLCYGFGMHGTTLAPGAARALVRRMFGEPTLIDDSYASLNASEEAEPEE